MTGAIRSQSLGRLFARLYPNESKKEAVNRAILTPTIRGLGTMKLLQRYQLILISHNRKTGPIPVSYQSRDTCPPDCIFMIDDVCYAQAGYHTRLNWDRLETGQRGYTFDKFIDKVQHLPRRQLWRYGVAGDLPGAGSTIDKADLNDLIRANKGKSGFTYCHKPLTLVNRRLIEDANARGFTISISASSPGEADAVINSGIKAPVVCVLPVTDRDPNLKKSYKTPEGRCIVTCPANIDKNQNCARCAICAEKDRRFIVGFPGHGRQRHKAAKIAADNHQRTVIHVENINDNDTRKRHP